MSEPERFDSAWATGRAESFDEVVDLAVDSVLRRPIAPHARAGVATIASEPDEALRPAVRVQLRGHFAITVEDKEVPGSVWKFARPRELLVYLLGHAASQCPFRRLSRAGERPAGSKRFASALCPS